MDAADRQLHAHATRFGELEPGARNRTFGCIAIERGFLTPAQLDAAIAEQKAQAHPEMLGSLLLRKRILTLAQILEILKEQDRHVLACTCGRQYLVEQRGPVQYRCGGCGTSLAAPPPASLASARLGPYEILGELGQGGIGIVYCARSADGRVVALKTHKWGAQAKPESLARFRDEAANMAKLDHPAIVRVLDRGEHEGVPWFAMELVTGEPLDRVLPPLALRARVELLEKVALGVAHAHERAVVHGDLTPANIVVSPAGPKILDFGLARNKEWPIAVANPSGTPVGTPRYMSPEEVRGHWTDVDERSDTWTLGVLLFEAVAGRTPFDGANVADVYAAVLKAAPDWPDAPADLLRVLRKALDPDKAHRYGDAAAFAADLRRWLDGTPVQGRPAPASVQASRWLARHRSTILTSVLIGAVAAVIAGFAAKKELDRRADAHALERAEADRASRQRSRALAVRRFLDDGLAKAEAALAITDSREKFEAAAADAAMPLQSALAADPTLTSAAVALARLWLEMGDDEGAATWLMSAGLDGAAERARLYAQQAILRDPHSATTLDAVRRLPDGPRRTAFLLVHSRDWEGALKELAKLPAIDGVACCLTAMAMRETGRRELAHQPMERARALRPRDAGVWRQAATLTRGDAAIAMLTRSLQLEDTPGARADRAAIHAELGRHAEAVGDIAVAVRAEPTAGRLELMGRTLMKLERWRDAREALERAVHLDPARTFLNALIDECKSKERR